MATLKFEAHYCYQCPFHKVVPDPDPTDSFNYDDETMLCTKMSNKDNKFKDQSGNEYPFKLVKSMLRPYETKKVTIPDWCPAKTES